MKYLYVIPLFVGCIVSASASQMSIYESVLIAHADVIAVVHIDSVEHSEFTSPEIRYRANAVVLKPLKGCKKGDGFVVTSVALQWVSETPLPPMTEGTMLAFVKKKASVFIPTFWMSLRHIDGDTIFWPKSPYSGQFVEQPFNSVVKRILDHVYRAERSH